MIQATAERFGLSEEAVFCIESEDADRYLDLNLTISSTAESNVESDLDDSFRKLDRVVDGVTGAVAGKLGLVKVLSQMLLSSPSLEGNTDDDLPKPEQHSPDGVRGVSC